MGITNETYFEQDEYMSVSQYKRYAKCEVLGKVGFINEQQSEAMLIGSYVDAFVEGTLDAFKAAHPDLFLKTGKNKGKLKSAYKQADDICEYITKDRLLSMFLSGDKQTIMTGEIAGVPFKIKMDAYSKGIAISDLKVMRTVTDKEGNMIDFITPWGYDVQMACYQEIVRQNTGETLPCYICAVTKETPINSVIVQIPQNILDGVLYRVSTELPRIYTVYKDEIEPVGCGKCKACIANRKETPLVSLDELV